MSLRIWMPLNGNYNNIGLSGNVSISNNSTSFSNNGKIGQCCSMDNYETISLGSMNLGDELTVCFWAKHNSLAYPMTHLGVQHSNGAYNGGKGWDIGHGTVGGGYILFDVCDGTNIQRFALTGTNVDQLNTWNHFTVACSLSKKKVYLYINGNLEDEQSIYDYFGSFKTDRETTLGNIYGWYMSGYLNDFRIYDHCLSPKEVKEISKGLVLHYKLDDEYAEPTTNYIILTTDFNSWGSYGFGSHGIKTLHDGPTPNCTGKYCEVGCDSQSTVTTEMATSYWAPKLSLGGKATFSCYVRGVGNTIGRLGFLHIYNSNGSETQSDNVVTFTFTGSWTRVSGLFTWNSSNQSSEMYHCYIGSAITNGESYEFCEPQFEMKDHVTPYIVGSRSSGTVYDSSGYLNNGSIQESLTVKDDSPRYSKHTDFSIGSKIFTPAYGFSSFGDSYSFSLWALGDTGNGSMMFGFVDGNRLNLMHTLCLNTGDSQENPFYIPGTTTQITCPSTNEWHHYVLTGDGTTSKLYVDGVHYGTAKYYRGLTGSLICINGWDTSGDYLFNGKISDFRVYSTVLSADNIKELYDTAAFIDNKGNGECFEIEEKPYLCNMIQLTQQSLTQKHFYENGLWLYQLDCCQCYLLDEGYRIYRNPNKTVSGDGYIMWGGFVIKNSNNWIGITKGHTYLLEFDIKGQSSNYTCNIYWTNQVGLGHSLTYPRPTNVVCLDPNASGNFTSDTWQHFSYKFTVSDDVYKECTVDEGNPSFVVGLTYLSYMDFNYGFSYTDTGELGTDLYINNLRMYDITYENPIDLEINKNGIINTTTVVENNDNAFIDSYGEFNCNQIIEI